MMLDANDPREIGPLEVAPSCSDSCLTSEQQLVVDINKVCELAEAEGVSAIACIGALTAVTIAITSQIYDLKMQPDDTDA